MLVSENWLREFVNPDMDTQGLAHQITMAGLEVEGIENLEPQFTNVVIGKVESTSPHPNADKLKLTKVNIGDRVLDIVCGAPNAEAGIVVPVALVGATLPNDIEIKQTKVRGEESHGMLCSESELGLSDEAEGLMLLPVDAPLGEPLASYLSLYDQVIEVSLTPNRGDCLSILGLARDISVLNTIPLTAPPSKTAFAIIEDEVAVKLNAENACPRYCGRIVRDVDMSLHAPIWMTERLRRAGIRSINLAADITNYVMLELGQPMHAFDLDKLDGDVQVRMAEQGEKITLLNSEPVELRADTMVIADDKQAHAIAGVMGGLESSVQSNTQNIFFESAYFDPDALAGTARSYGLHTDSSHRFERGVDYELPRQAIERATSLLLDILPDAKPGPIVEAVNEADLPNRSAIKLRASRVERLLGLRMDNDIIVSVLEGLGLGVEENGDGEWLVTVPSFRFDIEIEADLIEELARVHGYHQIDPQPMTSSLLLRPQTEMQRSRRELRQIMVDRGYQEAITYSFIDPESQQRFSPETTPIALQNPISADMSVMRTSLWPGLIQAASYNMARQLDRVRLFEIGAVYFSNSDGRKEQNYISGLVAGGVLPEQWGTKSPAHDYYDVKADLEALIGGASIEFRRGKHPALHPGQCAEIIALDGEQNIGWLGSLHPELQQKLDIKNTTVFELRLDFLRSHEIAKFQSLSRYPSNRRDIAVIVDQDVLASQLISCVRGAADESLKKVDIFDIYYGEGIEFGRKSVAIGLTLQGFSRTLTDADIDGVVSEVVEALAEQYQASLRD